MSARTLNYLEQYILKHRLDAIFVMWVLRQSRIVPHNAIKPSDVSEKDCDPAVQYLAIVLNWRDQEKHLTSDLAKLKDTADKLRQRYCQRCGEKVKRLYRSMTTDLKVCGDCYCDGK